MRRCIQTALLLISIPLLLGACGSDASNVTGPVHTPVGSWLGEVPLTDSTGFLLMLDLAESQGVVSGTAKIIEATKVIDEHVDGRFDAPTLSITISAESYPNLQYTASVSGERMQGTLTGSWLGHDVAVTLAREGAEPGTQ